MSNVVVQRTTKFVLPLACTLVADAGALQLQRGNVCGCSKKKRQSSINVSVIPELERQNLGADIKELKDKLKLLEDKQTEAETEGTQEEKPKQAQTEADMLQVEIKALEDEREALKKKYDNLPEEEGTSYLWKNIDKVNDIDADLKKKRQELANLVTQTEEMHIDQQNKPKEQHLYTRDYKKIMKGVSNKIRNIATELQFPELFKENAKKLGDAAGEYAPEVFQKIQAKVQDKAGKYGPQIEKILKMIKGIHEDPDFYLKKNFITKIGHWVAWGLTKGVTLTVEVVKFPFDALGVTAYVKEKAKEKAKDNAFEILTFVFKHKDTWAVQKVVRYLLEKEFKKAADSMLEKTLGPKEAALVLKKYEAAKIKLLPEVEKLIMSLKEDPDLQFGLQFVKMVEWAHQESTKTLLERFSTQSAEQELKPYFEEVGPILQIAGKLNEIRLNKKLNDKDKQMLIKEVVTKEGPALLSRMSRIAKRIFSVSSK